MQKNRKLTLFKFKNKEEKIISKIRKKKAQIEKLKNEVLTMGRLILKDGKLEKAEPQQQPQEQQRVMPPQAPDIEYIQPQMPEQEEEPPMFRGRPPQQEVQEPPMYRQQVQEPPMYRRQVQQQMPQRQPVELTVDIILIEGQVVQVKVSEQNAQSLLDTIGNSVETGAILIIGNKAINPRHIIMYQYA